MLNHRADAHLQTGDWAPAEADYREALATAVAGETWPFALHALHGLAQIFTRQNNYQWASALTTIIQQQSPSPTLQTEVEALWQSAQAELTPEEQTWVGERPLPDLAEAILQNKLPIA